MSAITKEQLICLNTLVSKLHIDKQTKAIMVAGYTLDRATSSRDMFSNEAADMIKHLKSLDPDEPAAERMRRKIISLAHEIGWTLTLPPKGGSRKADMQRIDGWCKKFGYKHKALNSYTYKELPALVTQFENGPYLHYLQKV